MKNIKGPLDDPDEVLARVVSANNKNDFFRSIHENDTFDDWNLARDFGDFLTRIEPDEIMGHALLARACRHLGELERAQAELGLCRTGIPHPSEREFFLSFLTEEERLSSMGPEP
jgi:hypothetical protein